MCQASHQQAINLSRYKKSVFTIFYILAVFTLGLTTAVVWLIIYNIIMINDEGAVYLARQVSYAMVLSTSSVNPILYCCRMKDILDGVKVILKELFCKAASNGLYTVNTVHLPSKFRCHTFIFPELRKGPLVVEERKKPSLNRVNALKLLRRPGIAMMERVCNLETLPKSEKIIMENGFHAVFFSHCELTSYLPPCVLRTLIRALISLVYEQRRLVIVLGKFSVHNHPWPLFSYD